MLALHYFFFVFFVFLGKGARNEVVINRGYHLIYEMKANPPVFLSKADRRERKRNTNCFLELPLLLCVGLWDFPT
jgi:hypothetical protein